MWYLLNYLIKILDDTKLVIEPSIRNCFIIMINNFTTDAASNTLIELYKMVYDQNIERLECLDQDTH